MNLFGHRPYLLALLVSGVAFLSGCSNKISNDNRWEKVEEQKDAEASCSTVLIEEYTGQNCVNCPIAADILHQQVTAYPGNVITVALHAKSTGQTRPDLENDEADRLFHHFGLPKAVPGIMVNRRMLNGTQRRYSDDTPLWSGLIQKAVSLPSRLRLEIDGKISGKEVVFSAKADKTTAGVALPKSLTLTVWLVEDVYGGQIVGGKEEAHYHHHNVLRQVLVDNSTYELSSEVSKKAVLDAKILDPQNTKIVAFISDGNSEEVIEAALKALGTSSNESPDAEKPGIEPEEKIGMGLSFRVGDTEYESGSEILVTGVISKPNGSIEMETPTVTVLPGNKISKYDVNVVVLDQTGNANHGLKSVCLTKCEEFEHLLRTHEVKSYSPGITPYVIVHYGLKDNLASVKGSYRTSVVFSQEGKEVARLTFRFDYTPKTAEEPSKPDVPAIPIPTPPASTPAPAPLPPALPEPINPGTERTPKSNVVVFDFTGQGCPSCYRTIEWLHNEEVYKGSNLITVAIHGNSYNHDDKFKANNRAVYYENLFGNRGIGFPTVVMNNDRNMVEFTGSDITAQVNKTPLVKSLFSAKYVEDYKVTLSFKSENFASSAKKTIEGHDKLQVLFWVIQNNMRGFQSRIGDNYMHQHIYRGSLNGDWGQEYVLGETIQDTFSLPIVTVPDYSYQPVGGEKRRTKDVRVEPKDCEVIAIVLDANTKVFLDAVKVKL